MDKKWIILLILGAMAIFYIGLLVGLPALERAIICPKCNIREAIHTPIIVYFIPGIVGLSLVMLVWKQKRG